MKILLSIVFTFLLTSNLFCQEKIKTKNVHYRISDDKAEIFYDLPENHDTLYVKVFFRKKSSPGFSYRPQIVDGEVGFGVFSGPSKKIIWDYKKEPPNILTGDGFYFVVKANKWKKPPKNHDLKK